MSTKTWSMRRSVAPEGFVVAMVGFLLTRGTVALVADSDPVMFLLAGVVPLVTGLGLAAFGVALAFGPFPRSYVRRVAVWCVVGTALIGFFVGLALLGRVSRMESVGGLLSTLRANGLLSSVLVSGSVGGTVTGIFAARNARRRDRLRTQAERQQVLNRLLRDRVLNAANVIHGRAELLRPSRDGGADDGTVQAVTDGSRTISDAVEDVTYLADDDLDETDRLRSRPLGPPLETARERTADRYPEATVDVEVSSQCQVLTDSTLERALYLVMAATVDVTAAPVTATVRVDGRTVSVVTRTADADGGVDPTADPVAGTKLELAGLLVERHDGRVVAGPDAGDGTAVVTLSLRRLSPEMPGAFDETDERYGVPASGLAAVTVAALVAGATMGGVMGQLSGVVPVIGALYGLADPLVGWITHAFHSVVFGLVYAGLLTAAPARYAGRFAGVTAVALAWAVVLWAVAAGVVMPVWLRLLGLDASLPQLTVASLAGHLVWGLTIAAVYYPLRGYLVRRDTGRSS
jgi:uncharacterized membrane protein YagU involved in acid resistance